MWLPSSVAFTGARVVASGSLTVATECSLYRPGMTRGQKMGQWEDRDFDPFFC